MRSSHVFHPARCLATYMGLALAVASSSPAFVFNFIATERNNAAQLSSLFLSCP